MVEHDPSPEGRPRHRWLLGLAGWVASADRREDFQGDLEELMGRENKLTVEALWMIGVVALARAAQGLRLVTRLLEKHTWRALISEIRWSARGLRRDPAFSLLAVATIAVGLGTTLVAVSLARSVLQGSLPYDEPNRLVAVFTTERDGSELRNPSSPGDFWSWREEAQSLELLTAARPWSPTLATPDEPIKLDGLRASPELFELLNVRAAEGTPFGADALDGDELPVVLSHGLARRLGQTASVGARWTLDGDGYRVAAIMPPGFLFPPFWAESAELWTPLDLRPTRDDHGSRFLRVFGRLSFEATLDQAQAELGAITARLALDDPATHSGTGVQIEALHEPAVSAARPSLLALLAASLTLLALVAFNLASLLVARRLRRRGELQLRAALGASDLRLRAGRICETSLLTWLGAIAGTAAAFAALPLIRSWVGPFVPTFAQLRIDTPALLIILAATVALSLALSVPGSSRRAALSQSRGAIGSSVGRKQRQALVAAELAVTVALLIGAGLLTRSFLLLATEDPGFVAGSALSFRIDLTGSNKAEVERQPGFYRELERRLTSLPEIDAAGIVNHLPIAGDVWRTKIFAAGLSAPDDDVRAALRVASPGYLRSLGARLESGRWISEQDADGRATVVINHSAARQLWPDRDPIGRELALDSLGPEGTRRLVVGVVKDIKQAGLKASVLPEIYLPLSQNPFPWDTEKTVVLRGPGEEIADPGSANIMISAARGVLGEIDRQIPLYSPRPLDEIVNADVVTERFLSSTFGVFALLSLLLATFGLFAVVSYVSTTRTFEFALRLALGSSPQQLARLVLWEGLRIAGLGIAAGAVIALALSASLRPLLFGIDHLDPVTYGIVLVSASTAALAAVAAPALRVAMIHGSEALRRL